MSHRVYALDPVFPGYPHTFASPLDPVLMRLVRFGVVRDFANRITVGKEKSGTTPQQPASSSVTMSSPFLTMFNKTRAQKHEVRAPPSLPLARPSSPSCHRLPHASPARSLHPSLSLPPSLPPSLSPLSLTCAPCLPPSVNFASPASGRRWCAALTAACAAARCAQFVAPSPVESSFVAHSAGEKPVYGASFALPLHNTR